MTVLSGAILASFSTVALSQPPYAPSMYDPGPTSLQLQDLNLSAAERAGYALAEGVLQTAEAAILAKNSCSALAGSYQIKDFYASGFVNDPSSNTVTVLSPGGAFTIQATLDPLDTFRGQTLKLASAATGGQLGTVGVNSFANNVSFNAAGTIMVAEGTILAKGVNLGYDLFQLKIIKDFYRDNVVLSPTSTVPVIYDWGLQTVSKLGYPVNKYWQRSKSLRDDGFLGYTHFVKDRLVGSSSCHLDLYTTGSNNADFFSQSGTLTISTDIPAKFDPNANYPTNQTITKGTDPLNN